MGWAMEKPCFFAFAMVGCLAAASTMAGLTAAFAAVGRSVPGAVSLTPFQANIAQMRLNAAINLARNQTYLTPYERDTAMTAALETAFSSLIQSDGLQYAGDITSVFIQTGFSGGISPTVMGTAACSVAATLGRVSFIAASAIPLDIANEGNREMAEACAAAIRSGGGDDRLAFIALGSPATTGAIGFPGNPAPAAIPIAPSPLPPPCANPSCT